MKLKRIPRSLAAVLAIAVPSVWACAVEPVQDNLKYANYYFAYPYPEKKLPQLTDVPEGYEPFHIEHYGRHGSRWHIGEWVYRQPIDLLRPAERNGKLTPRGVELMKQLRKTEMQSRNRSGELTPLGAKQHRGIARRMTRNFPGVFADGSHVDARSTTVIRCILSMDNELQEIAAFNPDVDIVSDASEATMYYMNFQDSIAKEKASGPVGKKAIKKYRKQLPVEYDFVNLIINDPQFAKDSIDTKELWSALFRIATNAQSLDEPTPVWDLMTEQNLINQSTRNDADWYLKYGNTPLNDFSGPMRQRHLLRNIIESADTSIMRKLPSANLRFGHDVVLTPLAVLMDLDGLGRTTSDFNDLPEFWRLYDITPMAANIQMVFYRPTGRNYTADDVLVKVLLNEKETVLPAKAVSGPYYRWSDLRKVYLDRIGEKSDLPEPSEY